MAEIYVATLRQRIINEVEGLREGPIWSVDRFKTWNGERTYVLRCVEDTSKDKISRCSLKSVDGDQSSYTVSLWGQEVMRSCGTDRKFNPEQCQCVINADSQVVPSAIGGGKKFTIQQTPWTLIFIRHMFGQYYPHASCTAVLIKPRWALTARHCVEDQVEGDLLQENLPSGVQPDQEIGHYQPWDEWTFSVKAGTDMITLEEGEGGVYANVEEVYWDKNSDIDMVLLRLDGAIEAAPKNFSKLIKPVLLPTAGETFWDWKCDIAGFGHQRPGARDSYLYGATTHPFNRTICYEYLVRIDLDKEWAICAYDKDYGVTPCKGDSGSGIVCPAKDKLDKRKLVGISSQSHPDCKQDELAVYAWTEKFLPIIDRVWRECNATQPVAGKWKDLCTRLCCFRPVKRRG